MDRIAEKSLQLKALIASANELDEKGLTADAEALTRKAQALAEDIEQDQDLANADAPIDNADPFSKGFGRTLQRLYALNSKVSGSNNLLKKLESCCNGKCDPRAVRNAIEELEIALKPLFDTK